MDYEEFKLLWQEALRDAGLPVFGARPGDERLELHSLDRYYECRVMPVTGQQTEPFFVAAQLAWRWDALATARVRTTEEDLLNELLGSKQAGRVETERPWLRVDVTLSATLPYGKPKPMPAPPVWASWLEEVVIRLDTTERLVPEETVRTGRSGRPEVLAWKGEPELEAVCSSTGQLQLKGVTLSAAVILELPRKWDNRDRLQDELPYRRLLELFKRVRLSLHAWMETLDHLC